MLVEGGLRLINLHCFIKELKVGGFLLYFKYKEKASIFVNKFLQEALRKCPSLNRLTIECHPHFDLQRESIELMKKVKFLEFENGNYIKDTPILKDIADSVDELQEFVYHLPSPSFGAIEQEEQEEEKGEKDTAYMLEKHNSSLKNLILKNTRLATQELSSAIVSCKHLQELSIEKDNHNAPHSIQPLVTGLRSDQHTKLVFCRVYFAI